MAAGLLGTAAGPAVAIDATGTPEVGDLVVAADGEELAITAVNPPSRTAGAVAAYTPAFGETTRTNPWGGEAVLLPTTGGYEVLSVCTALTACADPSWTAGDNAIPADGLVLSVSPGGSPDVRTFLRDHVTVGDVLSFREVVSRSATTALDATDPTPSTNPDGVDPGSGECYPGCRGAEQLIRYTSAWGSASTGTNDFGFEVTVVDGVVVEAGGNNRTIPEDGWVLSGHGSRGSWLQANAVVGATVTVDGDQLTATVDEQTAIFGAAREVDTARAAISGAEAACVVFPREDAESAAAEAEKLLAQARSAAEIGDAQGATDLAQAAAEAAALAGYRTAESRVAEGRGVWVRPEETTPEEIRATLDRVEASGFNVVFLETIFQGTTIYPSEVAASYGISAQRPSMVGFDPLAVWIEEAHTRGIEIHPWVHTFFVGSDAATDGPGPVLDVYPQWAAVEREDVGAAGPQPSSMEPGYYFVDPAVPEARAYVLALLEEVMTGYDVDGLHLDYIRYPVSQPWETAGYSYSEYTRAAFAAEHGVDPYLLTPDSPQWATWTAWRESVVTSFVGEVRELQQQVAADVPLSAAVFPDPSDGLEKKFQNWGDWVDRGYVDVLTGMSFGTSAVSVARDTLAMRERVGEGNLLYTATYGPFRGSSPRTVLDQVAGVVDAGSDGAALFAYNQLTDGQAEALAEGSFRVPAVVPHADRVGAVQVGVTALVEQIAAAEGRCVATGPSRAVQGRASQVERALDRGDLAGAERGLTWMADRVARGALEGEGPTLFASRVERDVEQYVRWLGQAG
nr:family 10 glycosylhydrolase [uncultured Actinotalea sp.]